MKQQNKLRPITCTQQIASMVSALRYNCICILKHSSKRFKKYTCIVNLGFPGPTSNELISYLKSVKDSC